MKSTVGNAKKERTTGKNITGLKIKFIKKKEKGKKKEKSKRQGKLCRTAKPNVEAVVYNNNKKWLNIHICILTHKQNQTGQQK